MERNWEIAARVWSGQLSSEGYRARVVADERALQVRHARTHSMSLPEITDEDLENMRAELPDMLARLR